MSAEPTLWQGNIAVARAALDAGVRFYAGYPITPSTEIAEEMSARLPELGGVFIQMEDEIASLGACLGASLAGAKVMTATSGPGFSLMQELIGYSAMAEIPVTIVDVMRLGPSTGLPTAPSQGDVMQARWGTHGDHPKVVLTASGVLDAYLQTVRAVSISETYRVPTILLLDEVVAHMRETVRLPEPGEIIAASRAKPGMPPDWYAPYEAGSSGVPPMTALGEGYRHHVTGLVHDRLGFPTEIPSEITASTDRLFDKVRLAFGDICVVEPFMTEGTEVLIVAFGIVARSARETVLNLRDYGVPVGLLELKTLWPFPRSEVERLAAEAKTLLVCELNRGQVYREVWRVSRGRWKVKKLGRSDGAILDPEQMAEAAREAL